MPLKKIIKRGHVYHVYYRRSGGYGFAARNIWKLLLGLALVATALWALNTYVFDLSQFGDLLINTFNAPALLFFFYLAEIGTGIIPPYIYIIWAGELARPYLMVFLITMVSIMGGITSYFIGTRLYHLKKVHDWVDIKFKTQFDYIRKFGGLLIFISAISPLPYPTVSLVAGVVRFPFRVFLLMSLGRFLKFFGYALLLYKVI